LRVQTIENGLFFFANVSVNVTSVIDCDLGHNPLHPSVERKGMNIMGQPEKHFRTAVNDGAHIVETMLDTGFTEKKLNIGNEISDPGTLCTKGDDRNLHKRHNILHVVIQL